MKTRKSDTILYWGEERNSPFFLFLLRTRGWFFLFRLYPWLLFWCISTYRLLLSASQNRPNARLKFASILFNMMHIRGRYAEAAELVRQELALYPPNAEVHSPLLLPLKIRFIHLAGIHIRICRRDWIRRAENWRWIQEAAWVPLSSAVELALAEIATVQAEDVMKYQKERRTFLR